MSWVKLDDGMLDHPKWIVALKEGGSGALCLWLGMMLWSARYLTDGVIPPQVVQTVTGPSRKRDRTKALHGLTTARLVTVDNHGTATLVNYLKYQPSRAATLRERERRIEGQQNRRHAERPPDKPGTSLIPPSSVPSRPVLSCPLREEREDARAPDGLASLDVSELALVSPMHIGVDQPAPELEALEAYLPKAPFNDRDGDARLSGVRVPMPSVPGLLGPSKREQARDARAGMGPIHGFDPAWDPSPEHRARGLELGLTDAQILERAEHCRRKYYPAGIRSEDDQFHRELLWLRNDLEKNQFKDANARRRFENPGSDRTA